MNIKKIIKTVIDLGMTLLISLGLLYLITNFLFIAVYVSGSSMKSNLHDGDYGFSFIISKTLGVERFDIVVIDSDKLEDKLVKRVIGLPGEYIEYKDNVLYVDGEALSEEFLDEGMITEDFAVQLESDEYYCLGDNRTNSRDSRFYGPFNSDDFMSTHILVLWPFSNFGFNK